MKISIGIICFFLVSIILADVTKLKRGVQDRRDKVSLVIVAAVYSGSHVQFTRRILSILDALNYDIYVISFRDIPHTNVSLGLRNSKRELKATMNDTFGLYFSQMAYNHTYTLNNNHDSLFGKMDESWAKTCAHLIIDQQSIDFLLNIPSEAMIITHPFHICAQTLIALNLLPDRHMIMHPGAFIFESHGDNAGIHYVPSYIPYTIANYSENMRFFERMDNLREVYKSLTNLPGHKRINDMILKTDRDRKRLMQVLSNPLGLLVNGHTIWDTPRPIHDSTLHLNELMNSQAFIPDTDHNALPHVLQDLIADITKKGIIVCSFGTTANDDALTQNLIKEMAGALSSPLLSNYHVIWKISECVNHSLSDNVHLMNWIPQATLLEHDRTKLFITHGGYASLYESIRAGKPMLLIPQFVDQYTNSFKVQKFAKAHTFSKLALKSDLLAEEIHRTLLDHEHVQRVKKCKQMIERPMIVSAHVKFDWFLRRAAKIKHKERLQEIVVIERKLSRVSYLSLDVLFSSLLVVILLIELVR